MQGININTLAKNQVSVDIKAKTIEKQNNDISFEKVINNKLTKAENKLLETKTADMGNETDRPKVDSSELETADKSESTEILDQTNNKLMQLIQMLAGVENSINPQDMNKLKQIISELLAESTAVEDSGIENSYNNMDLKDVFFTGMNFEETNRSDNQIDLIASEIASKLVADHDFRTKFITSLNKGLDLTMSDDSYSFKQAVINELTHLVKKDSKVKDQDTLEHKDFKAINSLLSDSQSKVMDKGVSDLNEVFHEEINNKEIQINSKPISKEDKLLKDLLQQVDSKNTKENLADKIANVVTRFDVIRTDKPATAEVAVTINRSTFNMDFIKAVKFMDTNNIKELSVKILPKDLGEIVIRLSMDNGVMKANITAANKETYNLLNSQLPTISNQLAEQNMNIQSFNLSLYNGDNFLFNGNGGGQGEGRQQSRKGSQVSAVDGDEPLSQGYNIDDSNINALA